jgi:hypothetical protein
LENSKLTKADQTKQDNKPNQTRCEMNLTTKQRAAIAAKVNGMTLPNGLGDERNACSIAAINLALTGRLTDQIPDCMSEVIGDWIIRVQDAMPDSMRNSKAWKSLLPLAAGTGRDHEREREALIMDWLWSVVLPYVQPMADAGGYGKEWRAMCELRTEEAPGAALAAYWAEYWAAEAALAAEAAEAAKLAARAAEEAALASGNPEKAWAHFDPCGLLEKLI